MKVAINITEEHIKKGSRCESRSCPIALAVNETLKPDYYVSVYYHITVRQGTDTIHSVLTPQVAFDFIKGFDAKIPVSPFQFEIDIPEKLLKGY